MTVPSYRAVLFDLDGTLLDSIDGIVASFRHVLGRFRPGADYTRDELVAVIGEPVPVQMRRFAGDEPELAAAMVEAYRAHNGAALPGLPLFAPRLDAVIP